MEKYIPKEITLDEVSNEHIASFDYYSGINYAKDNNLEQTIQFSDVFKGTHFIVCCGDIMITVKSTDYPEIERRIII